MSRNDWNQCFHRDMYSSVDFGSQHVPRPANLSSRAAEFQRLLDAHTLVLAAKAQYDAQVDNLERRLDAFSFENPQSDCTLTHVTRVDDPVAYINLP